MNIAVHRDVDTGMAEDFAEALDIESKLDTAGGKSVTTCMEGGVLNVTLFQDTMKTVFHCPGFDKGSGFSAEEEVVRGFSVGEESGLHE